VTLQERLACLTAEEQAELDRLLASMPQRFSLESVLFGPQLRFAEDASPYKTAVCSRRAGKSVGCAGLLLAGPMKNPKAPSLYFTLTRGSAKRIIWPVLLDLNRRLNLGFEPHESDLVLKRNGVGAVYLSGADNRNEIEKWRGMPWGTVVGDEAQALPEYLREAVTEVLMPALMDHRGTISLIGTPGPVPTGYFHECAHSPAWSHHAWTVFENPYVPSARAVLDEVLRVRGVAEDDPSIQREFYGRWVLDANSLVFRYDPERNSYDALPSFADGWHRVLAFDIGFDDADALVVWSWHPKVDALFLEHEDVQSGQTISQLAEKLIAARDRFKPQAIVGDLGALGKKIGAEFASRFGLGVEAADKTRKVEHIELLNDGLRTGRVKVRRDSRFARDALLVEWDRDKCKGDRRVISDRYHSDVLDSALYGYMRCQHWLFQAEKPKPRPGSPEYVAAEEAMMRQRAIEMGAQRRSSDPYGAPPF
jgi:hypothetical protein